MDPYIERPEIWPDFHDSLITYIGAALQPLLRPRYAALTQDRHYVVESERHMQREEIREPFIEILEPAAGHRVITSIEVLSFDNKTPGSGRNAYFRKREEFWDSGTNLVEIDLLRDGALTVRVSAERLAGLRPWHYLVAVTRRSPARQEVYASPLQRRLQRVAIPLASDDHDVPLDLQAVFTRCWDEGPYPEVLRYGGPPPGTMTPEEVSWCEKLLREAGRRPA
jgi:hypothetical protein